MTQKSIEIKDQTIHIWQISLVASQEELNHLHSLLSTNELARANRFKFEKHRNRFIIARAHLRKILSYYLNCLPQDIHFQYAQRGKPFLTDTSLQFNLSHSEDVAIVALRNQYDIGVDIEKIESPFKEDVAKRFFSDKEYKLLQTLDDSQKVKAFYTIWSKKEALIKALGEGLFAPLDKFSVTLNPDVEVIELLHQNQIVQYFVKNIFINNEYEAAIATAHPFEDILFQRPL